MIDTACRATSPSRAMSPYRPLLILALALACIISSYVLAFRSGSLAPLGGQLVTPPISILMANGPGRLIGQIGFPAVSLLFASCVPLLRRGLALTLIDQRGHKTLERTAIVSACVAFAGLAVVGALPLQRDVCQVMLGKALLTTESIVHQSAAAIFFLASTIHMGAWLLLVTRVDSTCAIARQRAPRSFYLKATCFLLSFLPLPTAFLIHPASPVRARLKLTDADGGGIQQYLLVLFVASFFASYAIELREFLRLDEQHKTK